MRSEVLIEVLEFLLLLVILILIWKTYVQIRPTE